METRLGILLWNQATDRQSYDDAARRLDELGCGHLWAWDHFYAIFGDLYQPIFAGYAALCVGEGHDACPPGPASGCEHVPPPRTGGEDRHHASGTDAAAAADHGRRVISCGMAP